MSNKCFVIMPFSETFERYYKGIIKPAIQKNDLDPIRADSLFKSTHIMEDIWNSIKEANICIAELTGKNPNVFYELGLAHAQKKPVILVSESIDDVPFDLRPLRVLIYDKNDHEWGKNLLDKIDKAIKETIKSPSKAIPQTFRDYKAPVSAGEIDFTSRMDELESEIVRLQMSQNYGTPPQTYPIVVGPFEEEEEFDEFFKLGDNVEHPKFGPGTVIATEGGGIYIKYTVKFSNDIVKKIMHKYANLKKISE
ncbi:MAG: nucleoside 2-deoxyribosyltransferase [Fibrobacterales bacterium]